MFHLTQMKQCTSLGQINPWWATNRLTAAWLKSNKKCERIDNIYPLMLSDFCQVVWLGVAVTNNEHGYFLPRTLIPVYTWCWVVVNDCDSPHPNPPPPPPPPPPPQPPPLKLLWTKIILGGMYLYEVTGHLCTECGRHSFNSSCCVCTEPNVYFVKKMSFFLYTFWRVLSFVHLRKMM